MKMFVRKNNRTYCLEKNVSNLSFPLFGRKLCRNDGCDWYSVGLTDLLRRYDKISGVVSCLRHLAKCSVYPALKRWAKLFCPSGAWLTKMRAGVVGGESCEAWLNGDSCGRGE